MPEQDATVHLLSPGAQQLVAAATQKQAEAKHAQLGVNHWLLALVERHGAMAEAMAKGLESTSLQRHLRELLRQGNLGSSLDADTVIERASERARGRGKAQAVERDLAAVVLLAAGYELTETATTSYRPVTTVAPGSKSAPATIEPVTSGYQPRALRPTPTIEQYGRDLTREAQEGKLSPVVARENEIDLVIETLCRRTKRNPVLVGPAGVGKTAIVEGLAQRVVRGDVPEVIRNTRILAVQPSALIAGAHVVGELEKRMQALLGEASQDGIILFIDEIHTVVGAGGMPGTGDVASLLKPALARGDLACIAATTDDEYRRFIEPDGALERRFQPIRVQELSPENTLKVLSTLRDQLTQFRNIRIPDEVLSRLVDYAQLYLRNRYFPDKAIDLLEQCVAHAMTHTKTAIDLADIETVVQRMIGMPLALGSGLQALKERLAETSVLSEDDAHALLHRLEVTLRGLDLRPTRPNATILLIGPAANNCELIAATIAGSLFGAAERVVTIDFGRFIHPADVTMLIGAPPGYVGYGDTLPLHRLNQTPWCVLCCQNVHACNPQIRAILTQALSDGFLTDARGKRTYLSDAIVLLTADIEVGSHRAFGFQRSDESRVQSPRQIATRALGTELMAQVDLVCAESVGSDLDRQRQLQNALLSDLSERYRKQGLLVSWDVSLLEWLFDQQEFQRNRRDWERLLDEHLIPLLIQHLPAPGGKEVKSLIVRCHEGQIIVEAVQPETGG